MKNITFGLSVFAAGCALAFSVPATAAARNYDCSKAGNANKAACKGAAAAAPKAEAKAKPAKKEKAKPAKEEAKAKPAREEKAATKPATATLSSERHYDCSKAGNANKAACKGAGAAMSAAAKPAAKPAETPRPRPAAASAGAVRGPSKAAAPATASVENNNPAGAIAQCKDGTYSHAKGHTGACSHHGGVGKWLG